MASIQGHFDPWHPRLLERSEAQIDLILEAYSADRPKELKFERRSTQEAKDRPGDLMKGWADVLIGDAKENMVKKVSFKLPSRYAAQKVPKRPDRLPPVVTTQGPAKPRPKAAPATPKPRLKPTRR